MSGGSDLEAIPAFLRLTAEQRAEAWARNPPKAMPAFFSNDASAYPRRSREDQAEADRAAAFYEAVQRRKDVDGVARLAAWKDEQRAPPLPAVIDDKVLASRPRKRDKKATPRKRKRGRANR